MSGLRRTPMIGNYEGLDLSQLVTRAVKSVTAGIAPHREGRETEEYRCNVPVWLRNRAGLPGDEVAAILAVEHPELGITSEGDLYQMLADGQYQRATGANEYREENTMQDNTTATTTRGFDADDAIDALAEFTMALADIDQDALKQLQAAWQRAYLRCGHKALARALVTGSPDRSIAGIQKRAAKLAVN